MKTLYAIAATLALAALAACGTMTTQGTYFEARSGYDAAVLGGTATYGSLPLCGTAAATGKPVCHQASVLAKLAQADQAAQIIFAQTDAVIFGCPISDYLKSKATPPAATCGTPATDNTAIANAITAAKGAITAAEGIFTLYSVPLGATATPAS